METATLEPEPQAQTPPAMPLAARLMNVFVAPGEVFDEIKTRPRAFSNWLAPALILVAVGIISVFVIYSQPAVIQGLREQQQKALDQQVSSGKITQAQADQRMTAVEKFSGPTALKFFGSIGVVFASFARIFWWAFLLWLLGRLFLKAKPDYLKMLEAAGLAMMISVLATVVTMLLSVILGRPAAPSLALLVGHFDPTNKIHLLLGVANVFTFWMLGVLACGLARLSSASFAKALAFVAGCWLALQLFWIFGVMSLTSHLGGR